MGGAPVRSLDAGAVDQLRPARQSGGQARPPASSSAPRPRHLHPRRTRADVAPVCVGRRPARGSVGKADWCISRRVRGPSYSLPADLAECRLHQRLDFTTVAYRHSTAVNSATIRIPRVTTAHADRGHSARPVCDGIERSSGDRAPYVVNPPRDQPAKARARSRTPQANRSPAAHRRHSLPKRPSECKARWSIGGSRRLSDRIDYRSRPARTNFLLGRSLTERTKNSGCCSNSMGGAITTEGAASATGDATT